MRPWILAALVFFAYVLVVTLLLPGLTRAARRRAMLAALGGFGLGVIAHIGQFPNLVREWIIPPALLLVGYWTSGLLFAAPMPKVEGALFRVDRKLRVDAAIRGTPHWLRTALELAYAGVYVLVPVALAIRVATLPEPDPDGFWTVVLVTDFICFACLPWIQTRPPRALAAQPWQSGFRRMNEQVLARTSIQHNTFPSGHAAEALASALLVTTAPWPLLAAVVISAVLVSLGAVLGRYHYAIDAVAGWAVALAVWLAV